MGVIRRTKQRDAIEAILRDSQEFQSAQQIHMALAKEGQTIGLATVYRNLQALADNGLLAVIRSEEGENLYKICDISDHHHHLVCRKCGKTIGVADEEFEKWVEQIAERYGFTEVEHSADMFGLCRECANKK